MDLICELPYRCIIVNEDGEVYPCCFSYCSNYSFGNIFQESFGGDNGETGIWNGYKAQEFRKQFVENDFKYCNLSLCLPHRSHDNSIKKQKIADRRPASVLLDLDKTCNVRCIFCTPEHRVKSSKFETTNDWFIDLFKDVENVNVSCTGEALASPHCREFMKKIVAVYPKIKFDLLTNGLLFDEENLKKINILDKLSLVGISFHSLKRKTYNRLVKGSNFDKVMKNVKYAIKLKKESKIKNLEFRFVITAYNYKEMVNFAKFSKTNGAKAVFMECIQYNMSNQLFDEINILNPNHPEYNKFVKVLKNPIFKEDFVCINKSLFDLKSVSLFTEIKNKLNIGNN